MTSYRKRQFPVSKIRRFLEPGPVVLVSSAWHAKRDIMAMGWHTVMDFTPSLVGCIISEANDSFAVIRKSKACVINLPTVELASTVVHIGNTSGGDVDKFAAFGLTPARSAKVAAPSIAECYANFECRLTDTRFVRDYNFFVFEVVSARAASSPRYPRTIHYRGDGEFMISGANTRRYRRLFKREMLD